MSSPTAMSVSGDEEDDGRRAQKMEKMKEKEKKSIKCKEGGKSGGEVAASAAMTAAVKEQRASADGATDGKKICRSPLKNALAKAKRTPGLGGAELQQKAVFPAKEGEPWVDPPLIMNPRVRGASRRVIVFFLGGFQS